MISSLQHSDQFMNPGQKALHLIVGTLITLGLLAGGDQLGLLMVLSSLLMPFPAALVQMRCGTLVGAGVVGLVALTLVAQASGLVAGSYLLQYGLGSFLLPFWLRRGWNWDRALGATLVVTLATAGLLLFGYAQSQQVGLSDPIEQYVKIEMDRAVASANQAEMTAEERQAFDAYAQRTAAFMLQAYPGMAVTVTGGFLLLLLMMLRISARGRYEIPGPAFARWKSPEWLIWLLIPAGFGVLLGAGVWQTIGVNLLVVVLPIYFLHGLAIVTHYFQQRKTPLLWRWLGYVMVTVFTPLPFIVLGIGVFDLWADFRKPRIKKT